MRVCYRQAIQETEAELLRLERSLRGQAAADRVKMLRLLKGAAYASRRTLAPVLGYSERQLQRWWACYQEQGLEALLEDKPVGGSTEQMTPEAWESLQKALHRGDVKRLKDVQRFLHQHFGITYKSLQGISDLLRRNQIDLKALRDRTSDLSA